MVLIEPGPIRTEWNTIARDIAGRARRGDGAYAATPVTAHGVMERVDEPSRASTPEEVADKIVKAALAKRPAARYPVGRGARTITTSRDLLPDRVFDEVVSRTYGTR